MRQMHKVLSAAAMVAAITVPNVVSAQQLSDQWQFGATIYGWFPEIGGKSTFPAGTGSSINVDADKIIDSLKFTFMGTLEVRKGRWGAFTDIVYLDLGGSKSRTRDLSAGGQPLPADVTANANLDLKGLAWTTAGTYRIVAEPGATFDVLAGARLFDVKEKFGWEFSADIGGVSPPPRTGNSEAKLDNWDAIVGVKGRISFGDRNQWFVPYYADVGTGDSDLTWQGLAGIGYKFGWGEVFGVYRYLDYSLKDSKVEDVHFGGPAIGVSFRW
jgi:hypothetical protein